MQKQNVTPSQALKFFVERLFVEKGFVGLDEETVAQIKTDLLESVQDRINAVMLAGIPAEKIEYFEKLLDQGNSEEVQAFCQRNIPDLENIVAHELMEFRNSYLNL